MNERTRVLAEQAELNATLLFNKEKLEKFAELIVRECIGIVKDLPAGYQDYRNQIEDAFRNDSIERIKRHFGVEE